MIHHENFGDLQPGKKKEMPLLNLWTGGLSRGYCVSDSQG
jgi:hypothetical protein